MNSPVRWSQFVLPFFLALGLSCGGSSSPSLDESIDGSEIYSGGETTVFDISEDAFSFPASNLSADQKSIFEVGNSFFNHNNMSPRPHAAAQSNNLDVHLISGNSLFSNINVLL